MTTDKSGAAFARPRGNGGTEYCDSQTGLTKREYFAAKAMQALIGLKTIKGNVIITLDKKAIAHDSINIADALIKELSK